MRAFLHPRAVAVVGASRRPGSIGHALLTHLQRHGFTGAIYPVNPQATQIEGLPAFARVSAIGAPVDLALIAVPAPAVEEAVVDCASAGVRGVVVISAGFAEVSEAGRQAEQRLRHLVRAAGMRLVGPNCMGLLNTAARHQPRGSRPRHGPGGWHRARPQAGVNGVHLVAWCPTRPQHRVARQAPLLYLSRERRPGAGRGGALLALAAAAAGDAVSPVALRPQRRACRH